MRISARQFAFVSTASLALFGLGITNVDANSARSRFYARYEVAPPTKSVITYCHGFGCEFKTRIRLSSSDLGRLRAIMSGGRGSAKAERKAISKAVQWFEKRAGRVAGTSSDKAKLGTLGGDRTQLDCIDESSNTTSLLVVLNKHGYLRHHKVLSPRTRGFVIDFRYPHNAAVVAEKKGGTKWAIDSWPRANGQRPDIMPLDVWMKKRS